MSSRPFFSIIVPTYNQDKYLPEALDSLIAQSVTDWEAIIINDGSTDTTAQILAQYAQKDERFHVIDQPNQGVGAALNEGLRRARGQWICWLSSDDKFEPGKLESNRRWIGLYPECHFFFSYFRVLYESTGETTNQKLWGQLPDRQWQVVELLRRNFISGISICIKRDAWQQVGHFDVKLRYGQDFDMWLRLLPLNPGIFIPEWTCVSRVHDQRGSETFREACLYDSAKAAIQLLNTHPFEYYFPLLDLNNIQNATKAVLKALEIASDPTSFVYGLGFHPLFLLRIMEFIWNDSNFETNEVLHLKRLFHNQAKKNSRQYQDKPFGFIWKQVVIYSMLAREKIKFDATLTTVDISKNYFYVNNQIAGSNTKPLRRYMEQFEGYQATNWNGKSCRHDVVVVLPLDNSIDRPSEAPNLASVFDMVQTLRLAGTQVLLVGRHSNGTGYNDGIFSIGAADEDTQDQIIECLKPVDVLINLTGRPLRELALPKKEIILPKEEISGVDLINLINEAPLRKDNYYRFAYRLLGQLDQFLYDLPARMNKFSKRVQDGIKRRIAYFIR